MVKKYTAKPVFHPHYNSATDRYYGTSQEYYSDLKKRGLEPYDKNQKVSDFRKPYEPSSEAVQIHKAIKDSSRSGRFYAGDNLKEGILKLSKGRPVAPNQIDRDKLPKHYQEGGWQ